MVIPQSSKLKLGVRFPYTATLLFNEPSTLAPTVHRYVWKLRQFFIKRKKNVQNIIFYGLVSNIMGPLNLVFILPHPNKTGEAPKWWGGIVDGRCNKRYKIERINYRLLFVFAHVQIPLVIKSIYLHGKTGGCAPQVQPKKPQGTGNHTLSLDTSPYPLRFAHSYAVQRRNGREWAKQYGVQVLHMRQIFSIPLHYIRAEKMHPLPLRYTWKKNWRSFQTVWRSEQCIEDCSHPERTKGKRQWAPCPHSLCTIFGSSASPKGWRGWLFCFTKANLGSWWYSIKVNS